MTYNEIITLLQDITASHKQLKTFGNGEEWEANGMLKPGILYPILYAVPVSSTFAENVVTRSFELICFSQVKKDKSNENEVLSDTELIMYDVIKILKNESDDYNVVNDPVLTPFKEDYGDWTAGWRGEVVIETDLNNNFCDIPYAGL